MRDRSSPKFLSRSGERELLRTAPGPIRLAFGLALMVAAAGAAASEQGQEVEPVEVAAPAPVTADQIDVAIQRAIRFLLSRQELDGSWKADEAKYLSGQTGHCVYTLIKAGLPVSHQAIQRGIAYLRAHPPEWTYGIACSLLAVHAADPVLYLPEIKEWTAALLEAQGTGFRYPGTESNPVYVEDLSLTQYGALGLRVAEASGVEVNQVHWERLITYALSVSNEDGSFSYRPNGDHTGSMTAAGIAVLHIAREALVAQRRMNLREERQIQERMDQGYEWLGENLLMDRNPDPLSENQEAGHMTRWALYYLYGLERVGSLTGVRTFGGRDWYKEASEYLVRHQGGQGQWATRHGEAHPGTCFGVLVLKRATAPSSGQKPRGKPTYGDDDPARPMSFRITGDTPLTAWMSSFGDKTLKKFEWDDEIGKGPRVIRVEYFNADTNEVLAASEGNPDEPAQAERFAARFAMNRPGNFRVRARAYIRPIDDTDGEEVVVESQILDVTVDAVASQGMLDATHDLELNALRKTRCTVTASSFHSEQQRPSFAADGRMAYSWLSKPSDAERWVEVEPDRPQRGDFVVLTPALPRPDQRTQWGRPAKVFLHVNGKKVGDFEMNADPFSKTYLPLKKKTVVRKIRVEIVETVDGDGATLGPASGFAEVELQLRPDLRKALKSQR